MLRSDWLQLALKLVVLYWLTNHSEAVGFPLWYSGLNTLSTRPRPGPRQGPRSGRRLVTTLVTSSLLSNALHLVHKA